MKTHFFKAAVCLFIFLGVGAAAQPLCDQYGFYGRGEIFSPVEEEGVGGGMGTLEVTVNGETQACTVHLDIGPGHGLQELSTGIFLVENTSAYVTVRFEDGSAFTAYGLGSYKSVEAWGEAWQCYFTVDLKHGTGRFRDAEGRLTFSGQLYPGAGKGELFAEVDSMHGWICGEDDGPTRLVKRR